MTGIEFSKITLNNLQKMQQELSKLFYAKQFRILDVKSNPKQHDVKGIYMISCNGKAVYIGKIRSGTVGLRIRDHVNINTNSDLNKMIKMQTEYPQDLSKYYVQYIEIVNDRTRGLVENFIISVLNPPFNKVEN